MGDIRFRDKKGKVKYIATQDGKIKHVGKDGKLTEIRTQEGKDEAVKIEKKDLK